LTPQAMSRKQQPTCSSDEAIDQVLAALRDAPVPQNMERRILNVLEASQSVTQSAAQRSRLSLPKGVIPSEALQRRSRGTPVFRDPRAASQSPTLRWPTLAACAMVAIAAALVITLTARHHSAPPAISSAPAPTTQSTTMLPTPVATALPRPTSHTSAPPRLSPTAQTPHRIEVAQSEDTSQISHPASPIPLTDQERILLRFARHGRSDDLAEISNDRNAAKEQQEAADFQAFFEPIKIGESE
jgi:hypothetical protein